MVPGTGPGIFSSGDPERSLAGIGASSSGDPDAGVLPGVWKNSISEYFFQTATISIHLWLHVYFGFFIYLR